MSDERIFTLLIILSVLTYLLRASFLVFLGDRELPPTMRRYLRYVAVAIIPGMIAGLVAFPASLDGQTNIVWLGATLGACLAGLKWKSPLPTMLVGALSFIMLEMLI